MSPKTAGRRPQVRGDANDVALWLCHRRAVSRQMGSCHPRNARRAGEGRLEDREVFWRITDFDLPDSTLAFDTKFRLEASESGRSGVI